MIYRTLWTVDATQQFVISKGKIHRCSAPSLKEGQIITRSQIVVTPKQLLKLRQNWREKIGVEINKRVRQVETN